MPEWLRDLPFGLAVGTLMLIVFCRAQATYWLGRLTRTGVRKTRLAGYLEGARGSRATQLLDRYGLPAITLSFLTVGIQTAVNASAGVLGITWPRYTIAMVPGCLAWALIYATVGFAAIEAWFALAAHSPYAPLVVVALVAAIVTVVIVHRRRRSRATTSDL